jgi:hypothetical protein
MARYNFVYTHFSHLGRGPGRRWRNANRNHDQSYSALDILALAFVFLSSGKAKDLALGDESHKVARVTLGVC